MNLNTKEFLMDILSLIGNIFLLSLITYLVVNESFSAWNYLWIFAYRFSFTPKEYISKK